MSQRDQPGSGQRGSGRSGSNPPGRPAAFDDEGFELPVWGEQPASTRSSSRANRSSRPQNPEPSDGDRLRRAANSERIPSLGDAFGRRESRPPRNDERPELESNVEPPVDDPYDRLRVRSARQRRAVPTDEYEFDEWPGQTEAPRLEEPRYPGAGRTRRRIAVPRRQLATPKLGTAVKFANQFDRPLLIILGVGAISLVLMAATVATRRSQLVGWMPIHLNAAGSPDRWGSPSTLWRLPLMVAMISLLGVVIAWFAAKRDAFVVQFVLASSLLVHALCWIALINLAW